MQQLAAGRPLRVATQHHVIALVGYDFAALTYTYVDRYCDKTHANGLGTVRFADIDDPHKPLLKEALVLTIRTPLPVPVVRLHVRHSKPMNVALWLSVEGSPLSKRQIWPPPQQQHHVDMTQSRAERRWLPWGYNSRNLHFTVRARYELMWPPGPVQRLMLDLFDSAAVSETGGHLVEFQAAFGRHVMACSALESGPAVFDPLAHRRFVFG